MSSFRTVSFMGRPEHLWRWVLITTLAAFAAAVMTSSAMRTSSLNPEVRVASPRVVHNGTVQGTQAWVGPNRGPHAEIAWEVDVKPHRRYAIEMRLDNEQRLASVPVHVDLYGAAYDNPEQEFAALVPAGATGYLASATVDSGAAPAQVFLRVYHFESARVHVAAVAMRQITLAYRALRLGSLIALAAAIAGLTVCGIATIRLYAPHIRLQRPSAGALWWSAGTLSVALVVLCNSLLGAPQIFADEYAYSATAAALHSGDWAGLRDTVYQEYPNRLFFAAYAVTSYAKDAFVAARVLNAFWLATAFAVLYCMALKTDALISGLLIAIAYVIGPVGIFTAYYMPEVMFATLFMVAGGLMAVATGSGAAWSAWGGAIALAALTYVKPNGWVPAAAMLAYVAWHGLNSPAAGERGRGVHLVAIFGAFAATWLALRIVLPDAPDRARLFGMYAGVNNHMLSALQAPEAFRATAQLLLMHLGVVACLVGPALAYGIHALVNGRSMPDLTAPQRVARALAAVATVALLALVAMTAFFTAAVAGTSATDTADRLHLRYYSFALPFLVLAFAAAPVAREWSVRKRQVIALAWAALSLAAALSLRHFHWTIIDAPDLFVGSGAPKWIIGLFGIAGATVSLAVPRSHKAIQWATLGAFTIAAGAAGGVSRGMQLAWPAIPADHIGQVVAALSEQSGATAVLVADLGEGPQWPYRVAAYAPGRTRFMQPDQLPRAIKDGLPPGSLLVGPAKDLPSNGVVGLGEFGELSVVRLTGNPVDGIAARTGTLPRGEAYFVSFGGMGPGAVKVAGTHAPEPWGAWSAKTVIDVELPFNIQGRTSITVTGRALGPNVGKPLTLTAGAAVRHFALGDALSSVDVDIDVIDPARVLTISGFEQVEGDALGFPREARRLGIGLSTLRIVAQ